MRENWKFWVVVVLVLVVVGYCANRLSRSFSDQPPPWVRLSKRVGPSIPKPTWSKFALLLKQTQEEADYNVLPISSIQFLELAADPKQAIHWTIDRLANQGFKPLANYERMLWTGRNELLGYYTLQGDAIPYTTRQDPAHPTQLIVTINLKDPLAPGQSELILRRDQRAAGLKPAAGGAFQLQLGRLPQADKEIHARGILLGKGDTLVAYAPEKGAVLSTEGLTMVGWINSRLDRAAPPLSARFTSAK